MIGKRILRLFEQGSRSQRQLSEFILRDPVYAATHGIEDLSAVTGISSATISRYVKELDLDGFAAFRAELAEAVHALISPVSKLGEYFDAAQAPENAVTGGLQVAGEQLQSMMDASFGATIRDFSDRIAAADQVWVLGFGFSAHLAAMLVLGLQPYRNGINTVVDAGGSEAAAARLANVGAGDLVIAITFPRYSSDLVGLTKYAKQNGAHVAGLTDSYSSPIAARCDSLLLVPAAHSVLSSSCLPALAAVEALVSEYILSDPAHVERSAKLAAAMSQYLIAKR